MAIARTSDRPRSKRGATEIAQFAPMMYVVFLLVLLPLIDLVGLFVAAATEYLVTNDCASKASTQADFPTALSTMVSEANSFESFGLAKFVNLSPAGGFTGCGDDLYVVSTDNGTGTSTNSLADQPPAPPIVNTSTYEMTVQSKYTISPLVNLSAVPLIGSVPGLGQPAFLSFSASRPVEHPGGLDPGSAGNSNGSGQTVAYFNRVASNPNTTAPPGNGTWNTPGIFTMIQAGGQTVVGVAVVKVPARSSSYGAFTPTGLSIAAGQSVWIDTQAVGAWSPIPGDTGGATCNANGSSMYGTGGTGAQSSLVTTSYIGSLVGQTSGAPFFLGVDKYNYPLGTGNFGLTMNVDPPDYNTYPASGYQLVRVIVVQ